MSDHSRPPPGRLPPWLRCPGLPPGPGAVGPTFPLPAASSGAFLPTSLSGVATGWISTRRSNRRAVHGATSPAYQPQSPVVLSRCPVPSDPTSHRLKSEGLESGHGWPRANRPKSAADHGVSCPGRGERSAACSLRLLADSPPGCGPGPQPGPPQPQRRPLCSDRGPHPRLPAESPLSLYLSAPSC